LERLVWSFPKNPIFPPVNSLYYFLSWYLNKSELAHIVSEIKKIRGPKEATMHAVMSRAFQQISFSSYCLKDAKFQKGPNQTFLILPCWFSVWLFESLKAIISSSLSRRRKKCKISNVYQDSSLIKTTHSIDGVILSIWTRNKRHLRYSIVDSYLELHLEMNNENKTLRQKRWFRFPNI
jgi:hypothetical protein